MKIKEQTRKLAAGCSKYSFEVVDRTDEVSNHTYGKATLTWFEEIFEEYKHKNFLLLGVDWGGDFIFRQFSFLRILKTFNIYFVKLFSYSYS